MSQTHILVKDFTVVLKFGGISRYKLRRISDSENTETMNDGRDAISSILSADICHIIFQKYFFLQGRVTVTSGIKLVFGTPSRHD